MGGYQSRVEQLSSQEAEKALPMLPSTAHVQEPAQACLPPQSIPAQCLAFR